MSDAHSSQTSSLRRIVVGVDRGVGMTLDGIALVAFVALFLLLFGNVLVRWLGVFSMAWFDEIVEMAFAWMVFFGAAALYRRGEHFRVDWLDERLMSRPRLRNTVLIVVSLISLLFLGYLLFYGWRLVARTNDVTPIFAISRRILYIGIPISASLMVIYEVIRLVERFVDLATGNSR